jgi:regulator of protease activity HflC (stomatin/prohibitin superfamily)
MLKKLFVVSVMGLLFVSISACALFGSQVTIADNERGVVANEKGEIQVLEPGTHMLPPFTGDAIIYPMTDQTYVMSAQGATIGNDSVEARSKDGRILMVDASVTFRYLPSHLAEIRRIWQDPERFVSGYIRPVTRNIVYNTACQANYEDIISSKRSEIEAVISQKLAEEFSKQGVELVKFSLLDVRGE